MKKAKKLLSIVVALAMVLCMNTMVFAASSIDTEFTITVTDAAQGETYSAYKIFDVTYDDDDNYSYTIDTGSAWYSTVEAATDVFTLTSIEGIPYDIVTVNEGVEDDAIIAVFTNAGVPEGADAAATVTGDGSDTAVLDVTKSGAGYYYVTTSLGSLVIIDTTNPNPSIAEKNGYPTIEKWVHENTAEEGEWGHEDDANNEDLVLFELKVADIQGAVNLVIHDSMDDELVIPDETNFHLASINLVDGDSSTTLIENEDYTISIGTCTKDACTLDNCAFEINFTDYDFTGVSDNAYIVLTYQLLLNTEGDAYAEDYEEIDNFAQVTYGTSTYSASTPVQAETYSYGFETFKYTGENEPLSGVEFALKNRSGGATAYFKTEEVGEGENIRTIYLFEGWSETAGNEYTQTLVSGSDGMIYVEGLDTGTYILEETKALDGYNPLTGPVTVTIAASYNEDTGFMTSHEVTYAYGDDKGTGVVNIVNNTGSILPGTGGMGTTIFYIVGIILVCGAAVVLISRRRMHSAE